MNPRCTLTWIGFGHFPDKLADFTISARSSRTFGFEFLEKFKTLSVPTDNGIRFYMARYLLVEVVGELSNSTQLVSSTVFNLLK